MSRNGNRPVDPVEAADALGAKWSPDIDARVAGRISARQVRCVLCTKAPCECPPFGTAEYLALMERAHGK